MKMLHHKFCALFMVAKDFKCYLDETASPLEMEMKRNERESKIIKRYCESR
jgi:hypothetical protein